MSNRRSTIWVDAQGRTRQTLVTCASSVGSATLQTALDGKSLATPQLYFEGPPVQPGGSPTTGTYQDVSDYATLSFLCIDGTIATLTLVAPDSTIFKADQETVDATQITAIVTAAVGQLTSGSGSLAASFIAGTRKRGSRRDYQ